MKSASSALITFLDTATELIPADLFTFSLTNGQVLRYNSTDVDLTYAGQTFLGRSGAARIQRSKLKQKLGLSADDKMKLDIFYDSTVIYGQVSWPQALARGDFRAAMVEVDRLFMPTWGDTSKGAIIWWLGYVADVDPIGRTTCSMNVRTIVEKLNIQLPRNILQRSCRWTLFDSGCTLNPAAFVVGGSVTSGSTTQIVNATGLLQAQDYFTQGKIVFTSGQNAGMFRTIRQFNSGGIIVPALPLPYSPAIGDAFQIYPGCDKLQSTCQTKFSNLVNFGGQPYIPAPETAL